MIQLYAHTHTQQVTFYGSRFIDDRWPVVGREVTVEGLKKPAVVNNDGMYIFGTDGKKVHCKRAYMYVFKTHKVWKSL